MARNTILSGVKFKISVQLGRCFGKLIIRNFTPIKLEFIIGKAVKKACNPAEYKRFYFWLVEVL